MKNLHNLNELLKKATQLISQSKIKECLNSILESENPLLLEHKNYFNLQSSRIANLEKKYYSVGEDNLTERNKIADSILGKISEISELENQKQGNQQGKENNKTFYEKLSLELALNYFTVSFSDRYRDKHGCISDEIDETVHNVFKEKTANEFIIDRNRKICRNIFVIGAGATFNNFKTFPHGNEMREVLKKELKIAEFVQKIDKYNSILSQKFKEAEDYDFEKYISFLVSVFGKDRIAEKLKKYYNVRYMPSLSYEIIAHLLKHGFIDVVINFNFDELLDQTIEEEVGQGNYYKIVSDGDVVELKKIIVNGSIKVPVYFKVHGTASNKSTLNLAKNNNFEIKTEVYDLIKQIISGKREGGYDNIPIVNVTTIGYSMQNQQFNSILEESDTHLFHMNIGYEPIAQSDKINKSSQGFLNLESIHTKEGLSPLDIALRNLWREITLLFKDTFVPRQIDRHEIISHIFYEYKVCGEVNPRYSIENAREILKNYFDQFYFLDRVIIEIGMLIAKNKGILDFHEMMPERLSNYYHLYRRLKEEKKENDYTTLYSIAMEVFKMKEKYDFSGNLLIFPPIEESELPNAFPLWLDIILEGYNKEKALEQLNTSKAKQILFRYFKNAEAVKGGKMIEKILDGLNSKDESRRNAVKLKIKSTLKNLNNLIDDFVYDINPKFEDRKLYRFSSYNKSKILHTNLGLNYEIFSKFINSKDWEVLLMVSERGKTIKKAMKRLQKNQLQALNTKTIIIICAYEVVQEEVSNRYGEQKRSIKELIHDYKNMLCEKEKRTFNGNDQNDEKKGNTGQQYESESPEIKAIIQKLTIILIPYREHSNHMTLFLTTNEEKAFEHDRISLHIQPRVNVEEKNKPIIIGLDSVYYYKKGISNKINPMSISKASDLLMTQKSFSVQDNKHLLKIFFKYYLIGRVFEQTNYMVGYVTDNSTFKIGKSNKEYGLYEFIDVLKRGKLNELDCTGNNVFMPITGSEIK